jgi:phosphohistidine swiveling domain-containing protein
MTMMERSTGTPPVAPLQWEAPGPGFWGHDGSHFPKAATMYFIEALTELAHNPETAQGFRDYGLLIAGYAVGAVNSYLYLQLRFVGAPTQSGQDRQEAPTPLPDPELRYREERAALVFATRQWRLDQARWQHELEPPLRARLQALQQVDPTRIDDAALRQHMHATRKTFIEGYQLHYNLLPIDAIPVGDWLWHTCKWAGVTAAEALQVVRGRARGAMAPLTLLDHLVEAVQRSSVALSILSNTHMNATDRLERLGEASPTVAARLSDYLYDYGDRLVTGWDVCELTLRELPHLLLGSITAKAEGQAPHQEKAVAEESAAQLRQRVPEARRAEYDVLFEEACFAFGLQEANVGLTMYWPAGLVRRALLAAGSRLVASGLIEQPVHVLEATQAELDALFGGPGEAPSATELARRAAARHAFNQITPPHTLGEPDTSPPDDALPPALSRVTKAYMSYLMNMDTDQQKQAQNTEKHLHGLGVSQGTYTGRARVVQSSADYEKVEAGDILVAPFTSSGYNVLLPLLGAIVTDGGGALCHTAIVAREFGIPAVVGTSDATERIRDGARLLVDGTHGVVEIQAGADQ